MSWSTETLVPRGAEAEPPESLFAPAARPRVARGPCVPAWPVLVVDVPAGKPAGAAGTPTQPDGRQTPALVFGEADIARVAAAAADRATRRALAELERGLEAKRAEALDRAAASLAEIAASRHGEAAGARDQVVALAAAIAEAVRPGRDVAEAIGAALEALPGAAAVRVLVDDLAAAPLRASLPEIAARAGFAGGVEIVADPRLAPGSVQVVGPGGWLEHDPVRIRERVAEALAAHRFTETTADEPLAAPAPAPREPRCR
jgi:hypothetical protein